MNTFYTRGLPWSSLSFDARKKVSRIVVVDIIAP